MRKHIVDTSKAVDIRVNYAQNKIWNPNKSEDFINKVFFSD